MSRLTCLKARPFSVNKNTILTGVVVSSVVTAAICGANSEIDPLVLMQKLLLENLFKYTHWRFQFDIRSW